MLGRKFKNFILYWFIDKKNLQDVVFLKNIKKITVPKFPFDGKFLIKKGIQEGKNRYNFKEAEQVWLKIILIYLLKNLKLLLKKYYF